MYVETGGEMCVCVFDAGGLGWSDGKTVQAGNWLQDVVGPPASSRQARHGSQPQEQVCLSHSTQLLAS